MKRVIQNIKTFFIEFNYLKSYFTLEVNKLTNERLMGEYLDKKKYLVEHQVTNKELFEKYKQYCEKPSKNYGTANR